MKKYIKIISIILLLISLVLPLTYSYAIDKFQENKFFEVSNTQVSKTENVEMIINLENIQYNKFIFELESDQNISEIDVSEGQVEIEKGNNEIVMEINKQNNQLKNIALSYTIPDEKEIGNKIKFIATITNCENEEETESIEYEIEIIEKSEDNKNEDSTEKPEDNVENDKEQDTVKVPENNNSKTEQISNNTTINSNINNMQKVVSTVTKKSSQNITETVTYNGSNNNYLSNLSIENYSLNKEFSKENSTYFIEVENDVNILNITATAEDETGTVCIYGNENLEQDNNKILISVTAENGNVRNYRIYVTKKT